MKEITLNTSKVVLTFYKDIRNSSLPSHLQQLCLYLCATLNLIKLHCTKLYIWPKNATKVLIRTQRIECAKFYPLHSQCSIRKKELLTNVVTGEGILSLGAEGTVGLWKDHHFIGLNLLFSYSQCVSSYMYIFNTWWLIIIVDGDVLRMLVR